MDFSIAFTPAAASLTGFRSNATALDWALTATVPADGLAHQVTVRNDSATNHSAKTIDLVGTDASGAALTETIAAPNTSATVTSTKFFHSLLSATPSATIGADTMDIGWGQSSVSHPFIMPESADLPWFQVIATGTINFDLATTMAIPFSQSAVWSNDGGFTAKTATVTPAAVATRCRAVRLEVNTVTAGATLLINCIARDPLQ